MIKIDNVDKACNIAKNIFALIAIALAIWLYFSFFGLLRKELKDKREQIVLEEFNILSAKFKVSEAKLSISDKLNKFFVGTAQQFKDQVKSSAPQNAHATEHGSVTASASRKRKRVARAA